jgi:hypothetical protein
MEGNKSPEESVAAIIIKTPEKIPNKKAVTPARANRLIFMASPRRRVFYPRCSMNEKLNYNRLIF